MKTNILFCLILFLGGSKLHAQSWLQHTDSLSNSTFEMPTAAVTATEDSSKLKMYACEVDSLLGLQVHIIDSAYLDDTDTLMTNALAMNANDTLRAFAQLLLLATNSTLTSIADITVAGKPGLEIGIEYNFLASNIPTLTFIRYFLINHKFISYTISGSSIDVMRLTNYKNLFFNSINFY